MEAVVLGLGEVGVPIFNMLRSAYKEEVEAFDPAVPKHDLFPKGHARFMHVCFPQSTEFVGLIADYEAAFRPEYIIIHSTLSPGMQMYLDGARPNDPEREYYPSVVYSPVRGNIKDGMEWSLRNYSKYVSAYGFQKHEWEPIMVHLEYAGFKPRWRDSSESLEFAKILDLALYGLNIAFFQEVERLAKERSLDYDLIREFIESTPEESGGLVPRTVYYGGFIGGHCVIPAIEKVLAEKDIPMLKAVLESNIKREKELLYGKPDHHP